MPGPSGLDPVSGRARSSMRWVRLSSWLMREESSASTRGPLRLILFIARSLTTVGLEPPPVNSTQAFGWWQVA